MQDLGYDDIDEATNENDAVQKALAKDYDLILMDVKMPEEDREAGFRAAKRILNKKKDNAPSIILVTGEPETMNAGIEMQLAGMIRKPFTFELVESAMREFREKGRVGWPEDLPVDLEKELPHEFKFMNDISRSAHITRPLADVLGDILEKLNTATNADAVAVFSWHLLIKEVHLEASNGIEVEHFELCKPNLHRSPVTDLVYRPKQPIFYNDIDTQAYGKFYYLRQSGTHE